MAATRGRVESPFRALAENTADAIITIDDSDRIVYANPAAAETFGYTRAELLELPFTELIPPRFRAAHREGLERYIQSGERRIPWNGVELPGLRRDGTEVPLEVSFGEHTVEDQRRFTGVMRDISQRKRDEEALRDTTETLQALVRSSPIAIVGLDPEGTVDLWSPSAERIFGWPAEEVLGRPLPSLPPDREEEYEDLRQRALEGEAIHQHETVRRRRDGSLVEVSLSVAPRVDPQGGVGGTIALFADISERKEAERAMKAGQRRLRLLAEAGRELSVSLDPDETLARLTRMIVPRIADWCVVHLREEGELRPVAAAHRDGPFDPERVESIFPLRMEGTPDLEEVARTRDPVLLGRAGSAPPSPEAPEGDEAGLLDRLGLASLIHVPLVARDETLGVLTLVLGTSERRYEPDDLDFAAELASRAALGMENARLFDELSQRAEEEEALRRAAEAVAATFSIEEVIRRIAESALVATEADGAFVQRIADDVDEVTVVAAEGRNLPPVGSAGPYEGSLAAHVVERGEPVVIAALEDADTEILDRLRERCGPCAALIVPLHDGGEPIGALVLVRDGDQGGFAPSHVERAVTFADLAALAFRKLHLLEETERRREELERVTESRARLIRGFSHDVKNPLGAADGHLELLEEGIIDELTPAQAESVGRIRRSIGSALSLIDDLSELARAETGEVRLEPAPTDLAEIARDMVEEYRPQAERKGLRIELDLPDQLPVIRSDPSRARQILGNLVSNAVKYTDEGGIRVEVDRDEEGVLVRVVDTGRGIAREELGQLFREFRRLSSAGGETEGAGLGLAISQRIARALGGEITVESEAGEGSTFTARFPRRSGPDPSR